MLQKIKLVLKLRTMGIPNSLMTTIKYLSYRLGDKVYAGAKNAFSGGKTTPPLKEYFSALVDGASGEEGWNSTVSHRGPGYIYFNMAFVSDLSYRGAKYLLNVMMPFFRMGDYAPIITVHIPETRYFFVHYCVKGKLDFRVIPFTDTLNLSLTHDEIFHRVAEILPTELSPLEKRLKKALEETL